MAASTNDVTLGSGFANNLLRHPVEFAQASLTMQRISAGRFEAGLGAGWSEDELIRTGRAAVAAPERAERLIEAVQLVRELFHNGSSTFRGRHYRIDVSELERLASQPPPALVVGAGGRRVIKSVAPLVDKLELMPPAAATRGGTMDMSTFSAVSYDDVRAMVDFARAVREDLKLRLYVSCCAGDDERTRHIASTVGEGFFADFFGASRKVADAVLALGDLGVDELHLAPNDDYTYQNLAPFLLGR
jgi:alkanesulfonate monooxygenase SsuD/methylene tetrahydromethanopterin reductase-like flavin-dependent oxidoreductase (luciferase family)